MPKNLPRYPVDAGRLTVRVVLPYEKPVKKPEKCENPFGTAFAKLRENRV